MIFLALRRNLSPPHTHSHTKENLSSLVTEEEAVSILLIVIPRVWSPQTTDGLPGVSGWSASWFLKILGFTI